MRVDNGLSETAGSGFEKPIGEADESGSPLGETQSSRGETASNRLCDVSYASLPAANTDLHQQSQQQLMEAVPQHRNHLPLPKHSMLDAKQVVVGDSKRNGRVTASREDGVRETWDKKLDFLLSVIGFAVDLGNVWRFPYVCYSSGGGAFLIPYAVMMVFGGLPLFYMELALGQFQRCGCISVWSRLCPMLKGAGFGICLIGFYVAVYYNTLMAWALYYMISSMRMEVPWKSCNNSWNTPDCVPFDESIVNGTSSGNRSVLGAQEFFTRGLLEIHLSHGLQNLGSIKWSIALCLLAVFIIVYFSLWKGIKSSGKAVWITAILPYVVLLILLVRGVMLDGAVDGLIYFLKPEWEKILYPEVWIAAASQTFFSLGPGFGVLLALSSYNKFHNNCYRDALITSSINVLTSMLSGLVVFSGLGFMARRLNVTVDNVAKDGPGLVFEVYPEVIAQLPGSVFWAIIFFLMLITLGLDSTFGGIEAIITGICDEWVAARRRREWFVLAVILACFLGALATTTYGGNYVILLLDAHGAPISILFIVFLESISVSWFYGVRRFSDDIEKMTGFQPGIFWKICWAGISPIFLLILFIMSIWSYTPLRFYGYVYPEWAIAVGWLITGSSLVCIPIGILYSFCRSSGSFLQRMRDIYHPKAYSPEDDAELEVTFL